MPMSACKWHCWVQPPEYAYFGTRNFFGPAPEGVRNLRQMYITEEMIKVRVSSYCTCRSYMQKGKGSAVFFYMHMMALFLFFMVRHDTTCN